MAIAGVKKLMKAKQVDGFAQVALTRSCFDAFEYFLVSVQVVNFIRLTHFAPMFQFYTHSEHHTYSIEVYALLY